MVLRFISVSRLGLHRPDLLAGFEGHGGDPFTRDEHVVKGLGGADFRPDEAELGEIFELFEEGLPLWNSGFLSLPFFGERVVVHLGEEGHLIFSTELGDVFSVCLLATSHEIGEAIDDDFLICGFKTVLHDDFDPAGDAGFDGARGVRFRNDGLRNHGDLCPLGGAEKIEFRRIKRVAQSGEGAFRHGHGGTD